MYDYTFFKNCCKLFYLVAKFNQILTKMTGDRRECVIDS